MRSTVRRRASCAALATTALMGLSACGGSTSAPSSGGPASSAAPASAAAGAADAKARTLALTKSPTDFPVSDPLPAKPAAGLTFAYLQCGAPVCALQAQLLQAAAQAIGGQLKVVKSGSSAQELQNAMASLIAFRPTALYIPSVEPDLIKTQIQQAQAAGIPVVMGIIDGEKYGIKASTFGRALVENVGRVMADWVVANESQKAKVVFYTTPELNFMGPEEGAFRAQMTKGCPACTVRTVKVPIASYGTSAPTLVTSDLQAHPDTTVAVFGANDATSGLVASLKTAGVSIPFIGFGPTPSNLVDIKSGAQAAGLGLDFNVLGWTFMDAGLRLSMKAPLSQAEQQGLVPIQWVTKENLTGDISKGYSGYPDYQSRFSKLWNGA